MSMTGREKIEAAFSQEGSPEVPAVIPYTGIFLRDHWDQLTSCPWWHQNEPLVERQMEWHREVINRIGQDWFPLASSYSAEQRKNLTLETRGEDAFMVDRRSGQSNRLGTPVVSGWSSKELHSIKPERLLETYGEIDRAIPIPDHRDPARVAREGRDELASRLVGEFGRDLLPICSVASPLWLCYALWGFEGMMTMVADRPTLVQHACERYLALSLNAVHEAKALGAAGIWLEECLTDMISPESFASINLPLVRRLTDEIRATGMKSIYYYCGNPAGKWESLLSAGADALSLEESKKGFTVDIAEVVERAQGRCAVLGNLDAIGILQNGSEDQLRTEISRQIAAGRKNRGRFVMSLGSPVTPQTPVSRVRLYCDLSHELGAAS